MAYSTPFQSKQSQNGLSYFTSGPPNSKLNIVCIHGWGCEASNYELLATELSNLNFQHQLIAISLPGHGKSSKDQYPKASLSTFGQAILTVLKELQISNIVLMGHSMGMRIILETYLQAVQTPNSPTVKGLIFLDGSNYKFRKTLFAFDSADPRSKNMTREEKDARIAEAFTRFFTHNTPESFRKSALAHVKSIDEDYNKATRESFISWDFERMDYALDTVGDSGIPVLNLQATDVDDENQRIPLQPGQDSKFMVFVKEKVPQVRQFVVSDSGHFVMVDKPAEVAGRVKEFVDGLSV